MGEKRNAYRLLVRNQKERDHRKTRSRLVDNIRMDLEEVGWGDAA
jgi:hypothetical protein